MARRFIQMVICDLCNNEMSEDEATTITFAWQGKSYILDVGPEELESLTMNTIGGLLTVAAEAPDAFEDQAPAPPTRPHLVPPSTSREPKPTSSHQLTQATGRGGNVVKGAGRRRYGFDDYYKLWGTRERDIRQLRCPMCAKYVTNVAGSSPENNNRKMSRLRSHLVNAHDNAQMWAMAAELRGDPYDPDTPSRQGVHMKEAMSG